MRPNYLRDICRSVPRKSLSSRSLRLFISAIVERIKTIFAFGPNGPTGRDSAIFDLAILCPLQTLWCRQSAYRVPL